MRRFFRTVSWYCSGNWVPIASQFQRERCAGPLKPVVTLTKVVLFIPLDESHVPWEVLGLFRHCVFVQLLMPTVHHYSLGKTVLTAFSHACAEMGGSLADAGGLQESFWGGESFSTRGAGSWISGLLPCTQICCWGRFTPKALLLRHLRI